MFRTSNGQVIAMEDRCPHRRAPLSKGRVEGTAIRCMYHGMLFSSGGTCLQVPGMDNPPARCVRTYPVLEKDAWLWIWMGDKEKADAALIKKILKAEDWNRYEIRCEGRRIRLYINGALTVDYTEPDPSIPLEGVIAVQIHGGPPSEAWYRDIMIRELP